MTRFITKLKNWYNRYYKYHPRTPYGVYDNIIRWLNHGGTFDLVLENGIWKRYYTLENMMIISPKSPMLVLDDINGNYFDL
jgi:hypothetical protein